MLINSSQMRLVNPSAAPSVATSPLPPTGDGKTLNSELWHACAGPLVSLPAVGSRVVYLPQGHSEQVAASTQKGADGHHIPAYPSLPPQLVCQLHEIILHADKETDEVYCQMTLQPLTGESYCVPDLGSPSRQPDIFFCKTLTASDTSTHGGFSVPRRAAEKVFPPLDYTQQPPAQELIARDLHDNEWKFRHIYRGQPKRHLLTTGWSVFVSAKRLVAGDSVLFIRNEKGQLLVGIRRPTRPQAVMPSYVLSSDSMHIGVLAAAAHAAKTNSRFPVFYNPRASPSAFVISYASFERAIHARVSVGMRFRMLFETEESSVRRFMGFITGISDLDPVRWPNSHWRSIKVGWDESTAGDRQRRVSPWEIEPLTTFLVYPPTTDWRTSKDPWTQPVIGTAFLGDIGGAESLKRSSAWMDFQSGRIGNGYTAMEPRGGAGISSLLQSRHGSSDYYYDTMGGGGGGGGSAISVAAKLKDPLMQFDFQQQQYKGKSLCVDQMMMMAACRAPAAGSNSQILPSRPQQQQQQQNVAMQSQSSDGAEQQKLVAHHRHSPQIHPQSLQIQSPQHPQSLQTQSQHPQSLQIQPQQHPQSLQTQSPHPQSLQTQPQHPQSLRTQPQQSFPQPQTLQVPPHPPPPSNSQLQYPYPPQSLHPSDPPLPSSIAHQSSPLHPQKQILLHYPQRLSQASPAIASSSPLPPPQRHTNLLLSHRSFPSEAPSHESTIEYSDNATTTTTNNDKVRQCGLVQTEPPVPQSSLNSLTRLPSFKSQASQGSIVSTPESTLCESSVVSSCSVASNTLQSVLGSMAADTESFHVNPVMHPSVVIPPELHHDSILQMPPWPSASAGHFPLMPDLMDTKSRSVAGALSSQAMEQAMAIPSAPLPSINSSPFQLQEQANQTPATSLLQQQCFYGGGGAAGVELESIVMPAPPTDPTSTYGDSYEFGGDSYDSHNNLMGGGGGRAMASEVDLGLGEGFSSGDLDDPSFLQAFAHSSAPVRTYTKVYKTGSVGRSLDVTRFSNYGELRAELARLFGLQAQLLEDPKSGWQLIFVDKENDWLLLGDDPWEAFINNVRSIKILTPSEVFQMEDGAALPSAAAAFCSNGASQQNSHNSATAMASAYTLDY